MGDQAEVDFEQWLGFFEAALEGTASADTFPNYPDAYRLHAESLVAQAAAIADEAVAEVRRRRAAAG